MYSQLIYLFLIGLLRLEELQSIDESVSLIHKKVKQIGNLFDSQDDDSVNEIVKDSQIEVKNFDYFVATTPKPSTTSTTSTTPAPTSPKQVVKMMARDDSGPSADKGKGKREGEGGGGGGGGGGGSNIIVIIIVIVVIVLVMGGVGVFLFMKQSKHLNTDIKGKGGKVKRSSSRESLASIETVASNTGKAIHGKGKAAVNPGRVKAPIGKKK